MPTVVAVVLFVSYRLYNAIGRDKAPNMNASSPSGLTFAMLLLLILLLHSTRSSSLVDNSDENDKDGKNFQQPCPVHCIANSGGGGSSSRNSSKKRRGGSSSGASAPSRILYLISVHNERTLDDAVHLFRAIRHPRNTILIHVDSKVSHLVQDSNDDNTDEDDSSYPSLLEQEIATCSCGSTVRIASVYDVQWSKWSMNLPTLWAMRLGIYDYADQWDVFINLSGDSLPVFSQNVTATVLSELPYNFVTSSSCETGLLPTNVYHFPVWWHKRAHYTRMGKADSPVFRYSTLVREKRQEHRRYQNRTVVTHFGSQWMVLQYTFCHWLIQELKRPDSLPTLIQDYIMQNEFLMSDETFFSTVLVHSPHEFSRASLPVVNNQGLLLWKNSTPSTMRAIRYERMDEHTPTAFGEYTNQQHYEVPESSSVDQTRPWGPYFLGVYDLHDIRQSGALFVRKVSARVDPNLVQILPVHHATDIPSIQWPSSLYGEVDVKISEKSNWDPIVAKMFLLEQKRNFMALQEEGHSSGSNDGEEDEEENEL